jgi:hypothetical protein
MVYKMKKVRKGYKLINSLTDVYEDATRFLLKFSIEKLARRLAQEGIPIVQINSELRLKDKDDLRTIELKYMV